MTIRLVQDGSTMEYTAPTGGVAANTLVEVLDIVGFSFDAITAGEVGTLLMEGVFDITKTPAATNGFSQGDTVWLAAGNLTTASAAAQRVGIAWDASATGDATARVRINFGAQ